MTGIGKRSQSGTKIHKSESNLQFLIYWKNLHMKPPIAKMKDECQLYNSKLKYKSSCRYLGAQLCDNDTKCIISETKTTNRFIKRMFLKENQLLHSLQLHYAKIHLNIKLPLIKTFFLAYTEIFAQILPSFDLQKLDLISYKSQIRLCQIYHTRVKMKQFRIFIGIPSPTQRWILVKLLHYYKIIKNPANTIYNQLINDNINQDLPIYNQLRELVNTWIPKSIMKKIQDKKKKYSIEQFRGDIITKITQKNLSELNIYHPFKVIRFVTSSYCAFYITNIHKISPHYPQIKKRHLNLYYELFYNFGWFQRKSIHRKFCKICKTRYNKSTAQHVICDCSQLSCLRKSFWINAHNLLVDIYNKPNTVHQRLFGFHVLQTLEKNKFGESFWKLICGANMYNNEKKFFHYNSQIKSRIESFLIFLDALIGMMASWVTICKDSYKDVHKIKFKEKFAKKQNVSHNYRYSHYLYNNSQLHQYFIKNNITNFSIQIFTDGAYEYDAEEKYENYDKAGVGIFISFQMNQYHFQQSIGAQSIFYAEMYAIAILDILLNKLKLPRNQIIDVFCDNQSVFESIYKQNKHELFPVLANKCRDLINNHNVIIHKIKSHVLGDPIIGNDFADRLAGNAIKIPFNHTIPLIWFSWLNSKLVHKDFRCYGQTVLWDTLDPD